MAGTQASNALRFCGIAPWRGDATAAYSIVQTVLMLVAVSIFRKCAGTGELVS